MASRNRRFAKLAKDVDVEGNIVASGISSEVSLGGGGGATTKTYIHEGLLRPNTGDERIYINSSSTLSQIDGFVQVAPSGSDVGIRINKNGDSALSFTILDSTSSTLANSVSLACAAGDYLTVDITSVGSTVPGSDLQLVLTF